MIPIKVGVKSLLNSFLIFGGCVKADGEYKDFDDIRVFRTSHKNFNSDNSTLEFHTHQIPSKIEKLEIAARFYWNNPFHIPACEKVINQIKKYTTSED